MYNYDRTAAKRIPKGAVPVQVLHKALDEAERKLIAAIREFNGEAEKVCQDLKETLDALSPAIAKDPEVITALAGLRQTTMLSEMKAGRALMTLDTAVTPVLKTV